MRVHLISVGNKMPQWVVQGYHEYAKRLPAECELVLKEITPGKRGKSADIARTTFDEGQRQLAAIPKGAYVIALDVKGRALSTEDLSEQIGQWMLNYPDVVILVGGPEGLSAEALAAAQFKISLSKMTFPHPMVRVILAEQLYRAWSVLRNRPYHRA